MVKACNTQAAFLPKEAKEARGEREGGGRARRPSPEPRGATDAMRAWGTDRRGGARDRSRTPPPRQLLDSYGKGSFKGYSKGPWFDDYGSGFYGGKGYGFDPYYGMGSKGYYGGKGYGFDPRREPGFEAFGGRAKGGKKGGKDDRKGKGKGKRSDRHEDGPGATTESLDDDLEAYFTGKKPAREPVRGRGGKGEAKKDDPVLEGKLDMDLDSYMKESKGKPVVKEEVKAKATETAKDALAGADALAAEADKDVEAAVVPSDKADKAEEKEGDKNAEEKK